MIRLYHLAPIYIGLSVLVYDVSRLPGWLTGTIAFVFMWAAWTVLVREGIARRNARRLHRIAQDSGSEAEEGYDIDWTQRPL